MENNALFENRQKKRFANKGVQRVKNEYRNVCFCAFYDANYKYISAYDTGVETNGYCEKTISVSEIPANAEYIRCSCIVTHRLECYVRPFDEYNILLDLQLKKSKNSDFK
jgi:hypothetical protein